MRAFLSLLGLLGLANLALTVAGRVAFPWPLEWMEGGTLHHALRLVEERALYGPPSVEFVPYLYPPLAYVPMAAAVAVFGPSLVAVRAISLFALAGTLALVGRVCARGGGGWGAGLLGAGLFAAGFGFTGAFLDLARVDAFFLLLAVAGAERLDAGRPRSALVLLVACAFTKQHGVLLLLAASASLLASDRVRHARSVAAAWLGGALLYGALALATGGWFHRYVVVLPAAHPVEPALLASFLFVDVGVYLAVLAATAAWSLREARAWRSPLSALLVAALFTGALGRAHAGGHDNVRLAAFALLVLVAVPPLARVLFAAAHARTRILVALALVLQLAILWQPPSAHWPSPESAAAFAELDQALARCADGGSAVALDYALLAPTPALHTMALSDLRMGGGALARSGTAALLDWLASPAAPRALAVGARFPALDRVLAERYRECLRVPAPPLATGHTPGLLDAGGRWQVVYCLREPVGAEPGLR